MYATCFSAFNHLNCFWRHFLSTVLTRISDQWVAMGQYIPPISPSPPKANAACTILLANSLMIIPVDLVACLVLKGFQNTLLKTNKKWWLGDYIGTRPIFQDCLQKVRLIDFLFIITPCKFNSSPLKIYHPKKDRIAFQPSIFQGYVVKPPEGKTTTLGSQSHGPTIST